MRNLIVLSIASLLLMSAHGAGAQAIFAGTWRPDPQRSDPHEAPDVVELVNGVYSCKSCKPPYSVKADGTDQPVKGSPRFDTLNISVPDAHTVLRTAHKGTALVAQSKIVVAADGKTKTETMAISGMAPHPVDLAIESTRISAGPPGSHAVSGEWRVVEADLVHHDEDTTYKVAGNTIMMTDHLGRSFTAKVDGTDAPYKGDPRFTTVSLKLIDSRTLEETDKNGATTVLVSRWAVDPDGKTMHATFDDTHGSVQHQTGHKLP
jgi:hypothetical protein